MDPTPETDAKLSYGGTLVCADFARRLERERDAVQLAAQNAYTELCYARGPNHGVVLNHVHKAIKELQPIIQGA